MKQQSVGGLLLLIGLCLTSALQAQQSAEPDIENNIICYAAKSKWVCAPADDQAQAREKARKLALGQSDEDELLNIDPDVEVQAMEYNNVSGQVQEPTVEEAMLSSISDFIPRSDALGKQPAAEETTTQQDPAEATQSVAQVTAQPPVVTNRQPTETQPVTGATRFSSWQRQYPERWSFQVIGTSNRHKLDEFITRHQLGELPYSIVKTQVNEADWWVVLVGLFDSRDAALAQRNQLPAALAGPAWVRQISAIPGQSE